MKTQIVNWYTIKEALPDIEQDVTVKMNAPDPMIMEAVYTDENKFFAPQLDEYIDTESVLLWTDSLLITGDDYIVQL